MKHIHCFLIVIISLFCFSPALAGQGEEQERLTIMGIGDSITEGGDYFTSYLFPLWQKLSHTGRQFQFIGPRENRWHAVPLKHCGFSGKTVEFIESQIDSLYRAYPADIVLLHAGHNHFVEEQPIPGMIAAYKAIIRKIQKIRPDAHIFMAQVITSGKLPKYSYIPELNEKIVEMVSELNCERVHLVDQATGFDWKRHTVEDKVHPNQAGGERMADVWLEALEAIGL